MKVTTEQYCNICDVVERVYQGLPLDNDVPLFKHTSREARAAAIRIIEILGLEMAQTRKRM
jgi:hypothetical protein